MLKKPRKREKQKLAALVHQESSIDARRRSLIGTALLRNRI
jgi:hypothetical protein